MKRFLINLVCVYKKHEIVRDPFNFQIERIIHSKHICGKKAPRKLINMNLPKYVNRFGEPLCEKHKIYARNKQAFPKSL